MRGVFLPLYTGPERKEEEMKMRYRTALAAGFVGAVAMAAAAFAQTATPGTQEKEGAEPKAKMLHRLVHSESLVQTEDGSFVTRIADHGEVVSVDGSRVTIKRLDGQTVTVTAGQDTKIRRNGEDATVSAIKAGDRAHIAQIKSGDTTTVRAIRAFSKDFEPKEGFKMHKRMHPGRWLQDGEVDRAPEPPVVEEAFLVGA